VRSIRVTVEPSRVPKRVWLKAVDSDGRAAKIIQNIPREDAIRERNQLLDQLVQSGLYDEVIGEPVRKFPDVAERKPWERKKGEPNGL
jgi:hypothetical protein